MKSHAFGLLVAGLFSVSSLFAVAGDGPFSNKKSRKSGEPTALATMAPPVWVTSPLPQDVTISCSAALPTVPTLIATDDCPMGAPQVIFINEIHYDNVGADVGEFVEIAGTAGINLANYAIYHYNGSNGQLSATNPITNLSGTIDNEGGSGSGAVSFLIAGLENGAPDGIALVRTSPTVQVVQFLSWEGGFTAATGPAMGMMSEALPVSEATPPAVGFSIQLTGSAMAYAGFTWTGPTTATPGTLNAGQTITVAAGQTTAVFSQTQMMGSCAGEMIIKRTWTATNGCTPAQSIMHMQTITVRDQIAPTFAPVVPGNLTIECSDPVPAPATLVATDACDPGSGVPTVWINEFHYDNVGTDVGEFIEIAGTAGTDLSAYQIVLYNGADNFSYNVLSLSGVIPNQSNGFGAVAFTYPAGLPVGNIQNGAPDGIALAKGIMLVQFLSYEGAMTGGNGVAFNMPSQNLPVFEVGTEPIGQSLQLGGTGSMYSNFTWSGPSAASPGLLNAGQTIPAGIPVGLAVSFSTSTVNSATCLFGRTITRTWSAMDACGNGVSHTQTITVRDGTAPTITAPASFSVQLDVNGLATVTLADLGATASDNCSAAANVVLSPASKSFSCDDAPANRIYTITATDQCGNVAMRNVQIFFIQNTAAPAMVCNDNVEVSLDLNCLGLVTADMILEGEYACLGNYTVALKNTLTGVSVPNPLTAAQIGFPITATVKHVPSGNTCWGELFVEDKMAPTINCGGPFFRTCLQAANINTPGNPAFVPAPTVADNCSGATLLFISEKTEDDPAVCGQKVITRRYAARDAQGLVSAPCDQVIFIQPIATLPVFPPEKTISCAAFAANPAVIAPTATGAGYPTNVAEACPWLFTTSDEFIETCGGEGTTTTFKLFRTWLAVNWCTQQTLTNLQIITVMDNSGPAISFSADYPRIFVSNPGGCRSTAFLPMPTISDCSSVNLVSAILSSPAAGQTLLDIVPGGFQIPAPGLLPDNYSLIVKGIDACGNATTSILAVEIEDTQLPTPICQEVTQVSVGDNGQVFVPASAFNSGSYDNCANPVFIKVRRGNSGSFSNEISFSCSQIGSTQMVTLRVYENNPGNGTVSETADGGGLFHDCMVEVLVEDKLRPECFAPANVTTTCDEFRDQLNYGVYDYDDNCSVTMRDSSVTWDAPGSASQVDEKKAFETCGFGRVIKRWTVKDAAGLSATCEQVITVNYKEQYRVEWPADRVLTTCDAATDTVGPKITGENCEVIGVSFEDQIFTVVPDACYKIVRTWRVINWCTYNPNLPDVLITKQNLNSPNGPATWIGAGWSHALNPPAVGPGSPLIIVVPAGTIPSGALNAAPGTPAYRYEQILKIQDQQDPTIVAAPHDPCDYTDNDLDGNAPDVRARHEKLWNSPLFWDPTCASHDLCEGVKQISIEAADACSKSDVNARYQLFLDLNGDGVMETVINSENPTNRFGIGVEWVAADGSSNLLPSISGSVNAPVLTVSNGSNPTAAQIAAAVKKRFFVTRDPEWDGQFSGFNDRLLKDVDLPYGKHKIKWTVEDNCGNDFTIEKSLEIKDCKKPTIICKPLAGPLMNGPSQMVTVWATDFAEYAEDNCCLEPNWFSIRKEGAGFGSGQPPLTSTGGPITSVTFSCADPTTSQVEIWTRDRAGNYDFCVTYIQLNKQNCGNPTATASVSGALKTEPTMGEKGVSDATVIVAGSAPGIPSPSIFTGHDGIFSFFGLPMGENYTVTPAKDINPTNGVSTYDLVLISKHILGAEPFSTPYKFIAGDVNRSGAVSTADIVELRKVILGIQPDFSANTSWRFVAKDYAFTTANPAGEPFAESLTVGQLQNSLTEKDFVAVKIGDLNGSAAANNLEKGEDRSPVGSLVFEAIFADEKVEKGQLSEALFTAKDLAEVAAFQFTLEADGAEILETLPKTSMKSEHFALFSAENRLTASWNGSEKAASFAIKFRAQKAANSADLFRFSSAKTKAEANRNNGQPLAVKMREQQKFSLPPSTFSIQIEPNPFADRALVSFEMAEAGEAVIEIFAADGRQVFSKKGQFAAGEAQFLIEKGQIGSQPGAFVVRVTTVKGSATSQLILAK